MSIRRRIRALGSIATHPAALKVAARIVAHIDDEGDDGWWSGRLLAAQLSDDQRRAIGIALLTDDEMLLTFQRDDIWWTADIDDGRVCDQLARFGRYQGPEIDALIRWAQDHRAGRMRVIDVGANIGTTSIPFALAGFDVIAIEPVPTTFDLLKANVERNGLGSKIRCIDRAIAESDTVTMYRTGSSGASEVAGPGRPAFATIGFDIKQEIEVPAIGLADLLRELDVDPSSVALVWCDVQGSEPAVVRTGAPLWPVVPLYTEFWPDALTAHGGVESFVDLVQANFGSYVMAPDFVDRCDISLLADEARRIGSGQGDVLLLPSEA